MATAGATTTTTTYYYASEERVALAVTDPSGTTFSYLGNDLLGSASIALDATGTPVASQLYSPYGTLRYTNGTMPGSFGFTGQRGDATTGLDYYGFRSDEERRAQPEHVVAKMPASDSLLSQECECLIGAHS